MTLAMVAWGETWVSAKILGNYLSANELIFWRFFFTTLGMFGVLYIFKIGFRESLKELIIAFVSAIILAFYNKFFFLGTKYGLASFGGIFVTTLNPIITYILVAILNKKGFSKLEYLGLFIGFLGAIFMLKLWSLDSSKIFSLGNIYFLLAAFTWPILTIVSSKHKMKSAIIFSFYMFAFTSLIDLFFLKFHLTNIFSFDAKFWGNLLLLSLWGTTFATTIYFIAVLKLGSSVASSFFFMVPLSALIFSMIFLHEKATLNLIVGGILGLIAVYILNYAKMRKV
jgi:drug/metabolite transporter (DMT)-like permease